MHTRYPVHGTLWQYQRDGTFSHPGVPPVPGACHSAVAFIKTVYEILHGLASIGSFEAESPRSLQSLFLSIMSAMAHRIFGLQAAGLVRLSSVSRLYRIKYHNLRKCPSSWFRGRPFCALPEALLSLPKRGFSQHSVVLGLVPIVTRDTGLNYSAGRLDGTIPPLPEKRPAGLFLVKIQPPLGNIIAAKSA